MESLDDCNHYLVTAPSEQGPPVLDSQTSRSLSLSWQPPEHLNGVITRYELYRNSTIIYTGLIRSFVDKHVTPYTSYSYYVRVFTAGGSTKSVDSLLLRTLSDVPEGLLPPVISQVKDRSVVATWKRPSSPNGVIIQYILQSTTNNNKQAHYTGLNLQHQVTGLSPFTLYSYSVTACTVSGCLTSYNTSVSTRSAAPDSQPAPYTNPLAGGKSIIISWDAPARPNGKIKFYDLYSRRTPFVGEGNTVAIKLNPNIRNYTATGLLPYTLYEFRVVSYTSQVKGSTSSTWTRIRTFEGSRLLLYYLLLLQIKAA